MVAMGEYFHSVALDTEKCRGCTNCIKNCPTQAIRVQKGKAKIIKERCIDCGECIKICPYHAKMAITDNLSMLGDYEYAVAIPAPTLYGQFKNASSRNLILEAFIHIGFDDVFEVARGAEVVSEYTRKFLQKRDYTKPVISSACPAVVRLIQTKFPSLIDNVLKVQSPMEVSAYIARKKAAEKTGLPKDKIGIFFISPCAAKVTSVKAPFEKERSDVSGVISIKDIYSQLIKAIDRVKGKGDFDLAGFEGIRWANSGGESLALGTEQFIAVDGISNVSKILEAIEDDKLSDVEFVEALACSGGCLGGPLTYENVYVAKTRIKRFIDASKEIHVKRPHTHESYSDKDFFWTKELKYIPHNQLAPDMASAIKKLEEIEKLYEKLPKLDCGACGAPNCREFAEDIVRGYANVNDCVFLLRQKVHELAYEMMELENILPPSMGKEE